MDQVIQEPSGGAHRHPEDVYTKVRAQLLSSLKELNSVSNPAELVRQRYDKWMGFGNFE